MASDFSLAFDGRGLPESAATLGVHVDSFARHYMTLIARGKEPRKTMAAIARELLGFIWAIGIKAEAACKQQMAT